MRTWSGQVAASAQAVRSTQSPSSLIRPVSSATGMNSAGEIMPRSGWRQRNSASQPETSPAAEIDQRLVMDLEAAVGQRLAQILLHGEARLGARVHGRLEEAVGAASVGLGAIHRKVGILDELVEIGAVLRRQRNADRGIGRQLMAEALIGLPDRFVDLRDKASDVGGPSSTAVWITANSSPPSRAIRSVCLMQPRMRPATAFNSSSPTWWPSESLMPLNSSMSI